MSGLVSSITSKLPSMATVQETGRVWINAAIQHRFTQGCLGLAYKVKNFVSPYLARMSDGGKGFYNQHPYITWTAIVALATSAVWLYPSRDKNNNKPPVV